MFGSLLSDEIGTDDIEMAFTSLTPLDPNDEKALISSSESGASSSTTVEYDASRVQKLVDILSSVPKDAVGSSMFQHANKSAGADSAGKYKTLNGEP